LREGTGPLGVTALLQSPQPDPRPAQRGQRSPAAIPLRREALAKHPGRGAVPNRCGRDLETTSKNCVRLSSLADGAPEALIPGGLSMTSGSSGPVNAGGRHASAAGAAWRRSSLFSATSSAGAVTSVGAVGAQAAPSMHAPTKESSRENAVGNEREQGGASKQSQSDSSAQRAKSKYSFRAGSVHTCVLANGLAATPPQNPLTPARRSLRLVSTDRHSPTGAFSSGRLIRLCSDPPVSPHDWGVATPVRAMTHRRLFTTSSLADSHPRTYPSVSWSGKSGGKTDTTTTLTGDPT
jgi:hypothetical protein